MSGDISYLLTYSFGKKGCPSPSKEAMPLVSWEPFLLFVNKMLFYILKKKKNVQF